MDGVLIVNKPAGMTSHDVVNQIRRIFHTKKVGHTGTLDPMATGVLIVLVGKACKILQFLKDTDKTYQAEIALGYSTDTMDVHGQILEQKPIDWNFDFEAVLETFLGEHQQLVPMTSAKKINGKKLMEYQRAGQKIEPIYQNINIYSIQPLDPEKLLFEVHCSSGTYVRSICDEFAKKTNNLGCMKSLVRTSVGRFDLDDAQTLEQIKTNPHFYSILSLLDHLPCIEIKDPQNVYHGKPLALDTDSDLVLLTHDQDPLAIYQKDASGLYRSKRGLW